MNDLGIKPLSVEGYEEGKWILVDFNDIIIHVFYDPVRDLYRLEEIYEDAKELGTKEDYFEKYNKGTVTK